MGGPIWTPPMPRPWTVDEQALREKRLRELLEEKTPAAIVPWTPIEEPEPEDFGVAFPSTVVENVVDTVFVPISFPVVVTVHKPGVPRWVGWTLVAVGAASMTAGLYMLLSPKRSKRRRRRRR
jgi:hypothetical protein